MAQRMWQSTRGTWHRLRGTERTLCGRSVDRSQGRFDVVDFQVLGLCGRCAKSGHNLKVRRPRAARRTVVKVYGPGDGPDRRQDGFNSARLHQVSIRGSVGAYTAEASRGADTFVARRAAQSATVAVSRAMTTELREAGVL